jgi:hypothetical protein
MEFWTISQSLLTTLHTLTRTKRLEDVVKIKVKISPDNGHLMSDFSLSPRIDGSNWLKRTDRSVFYFFLF